MPLYIWFIYEAHYYEITLKVNTGDNCIQYDQEGLPYNNLYLSGIWSIIELRVYYGYILSGMLYLMIASLFGLNKNLFPEYDNVSKFGHFDFMEKYHYSYQFFCLNTFELIMTIIIIIEHYNDHDQSNFPNRSGSYLNSMIILVFYGVATLMINWNVFNLTNFFKF